MFNNLNIFFYEFLFFNINFFFLFNIIFGLAICYNFFNLGVVFIKERTEFVGKKKNYEKSL